MNTVSTFQRVTIFLCVAVVLIVALTPGASTLPLVILVGSWLLLGTALLISLPHVDQQNRPQTAALAIPAFSPRPPPAR